MCVAETGDQPARPLYTIRLVLRNACMSMIVDNAYRFRKRQNKICRLKI